MNDILPLDASAGMAAGLGSRAAEATVAGQLLAPEDHVEISDLAQSLSALDPAAGIRAEKVAAIREAILNGTYETEDKLDAAATRLLKVLRSNAAKTSD